MSGTVISQITGAVLSQVVGNVGYLMPYHFSRYSSKSTSSICSSLTLRRHKMIQTQWLSHRSYKDIAIMPTSRDHLPRKQTPFPGVLKSADQS